MTSSSADCAKKIDISRRAAATAPVWKSEAVDPKGRKIDGRLASAHEVGDDARGRRATAQPHVAVPEPVKNVVLLRRSPDYRQRVRHGRAAPHPARAVGDARGG